MNCEPLLSMYINYSIINLILQIRSNIIIIIIIHLDMYFETSNASKINNNSRYTEYISNINMINYKQHIFFIQIQSVTGITN